MRQQGRIDTWQDDRGFGFITPDGRGPRIFVHIKAFSSRGRRPAVGEAVTYLVRRAGDGRLQAAQVAYADASIQALATPARLFALLLAGAAIAFVATGVVLGGLPVPVLFAYSAASLLAFLAYALDKSAARRGRWRISEKTLHLFALAGGWPGALVAQQWLRHKSNKTAFQVQFWGIVVLNCIALGSIYVLTTS